MKKIDLSRMLTDLYEDSRKALICPTRVVVFRAGGFIIAPPEDIEAGDIVVVPPSRVTRDAPSQGYIQGCVEKCWPQIGGLIS